MARKRRLVEAEDLDSSGSSSGESDAEEAQDGDLDPDERAERQRHRDPYGSRKRRRGNVSAAARKEQAQLGIWAAEEDDEGDQGARRGPARSRKPATLLKCVCPTLSLLHKAQTLQDARLCQVDRRTRQPR